MLTYLRFTTTLCGKKVNNYANFTEAQIDKVIFPKLQCYFNANFKYPMIFFPLCTVYDYKDYIQ